MVQQDFIDKIGPIVKQVCAERGYSDVMVATCISQAALESGWGRSKLMTAANAIFGIKGKYKGMCYSAKTNECYDGSTYVQITDTFRAYPTLKESVEDYFNLLKYNRYKKCYDCKTVFDAITCIKNGGYATSPTYVKNVYAVFENYHTYIEKYYNGNKSTATIISNPETKTSLTASEIDTLARMVILGKYGNGEVRKKALGSNYSVVQARVNEILKGGK